MLACPRCLQALSDPECSCGASFREEDGVLDCFLRAGDESITATVGEFYEERPFPDYRPEDDRGSLLRRGRGNAFTRALDEALPTSARVVELGCGTGQLPMFLSLAGREVLGVDLSAASLRVAEAFRSRAGLSGVRFVRGNLFRPPVAPGSADIAISTGVLHHTADPREGFRVLCSLVKPGGYVVVGLYNRLGRLLLPLLKHRHREVVDTARGAAWYHDQHLHPHETRHTVDEVLEWLREERLSFVSSSPAITFADEPVGMLTPRPVGGRLEHWLAQLAWLGRAADGGLWITVGRREET